MKSTVWCAIAALIFIADVAAADFGTKGGPEPANINGIASALWQDPYDMESLISYGTSKGGAPRQPCLRRPARTAWVT